MKKKIIAGFMLATMIISLTACGSGKGSKSGAEKYFDALEKTMTANSYDMEWTLYESDVDREYSYDYQYILKDEKAYGFISHSNKNDGDADYTLMYCDDIVFDDDYKYYDMSLEKNMYESDGGSEKWETDEYVVYKVFHSMKDKDVNDLMSSLSRYETSVDTPVYREYKTAIEKITGEYEKDSKSISFIKNYEASKNKFQLTMYAYDFFKWCDENVESYTIPTDTEEEIKKAKDIELKILIELDEKGYVSNYDYYLIYDKNYEDGMSLKFDNVDKLDNKAESIIAYNKVVDVVKPGDYKYAAANIIEKIEKEAESNASDNTKKKEYRYKLTDDEDSNTSYERLWVVTNEPSQMSKDVGKMPLCYYDYDGYQYTEHSLYNNNGEYSLAKYYKTDEMLSYLQNGTALPETPAWKEAYINYLENDFVTEYTSLKTKPQIALYDFDSDGVNEMIIDNTGYTGVFIVIGYYNNQIKKSKMPRFLAFDGTKITATHGGQGNFTDYTGEFKNGEIILTEQGHIVNEMGTIDSKGNVSYTEKFYWGNTEVSSDEYTKKKEGAFGIVVNDKFSGLTFQKADTVKNSL